MLWLASFPRSGNTFFRNVLHEVYGVTSTTHHEDQSRELDADYEQHDVFKTHLLPGQLPEHTKDWPAVYLIRDGRDSLVSIAHHRKDIVAPGTDFYNNLLEATLAQNGSFFGGWSENVRQWMERADIVIRFEDLIKDPIREVEKLRRIFSLPEPDISKLPTFKSLKEGKPAYGGGSGDAFSREVNQHHFRKGKVGSWKEEVPPELQRLILSIHGRMLRQHNYVPAAAPEILEKKTVLLEASKLFTNDNDGIKRYLTGLDYGMNILLPYFPHLKVALYYGNGVLVNQSDEQRADPVFKKLSEREEILQDRRTMPYEKGLLLVKSAVRTILPRTLYRPMAEYYERGPFRKLLADLKLRVRKVSGRLSSDDLGELVASADLIHLPLPQHFHELPVREGRVLVTVHDLTHRLFPHFHTDANVAFSEEGMQSSLEAGAKFLAVSSATAHDLRREYGIDVADIFTVPEAANSFIFNRQARGRSFSHIRSRYGLPEGDYLFTLSTIEPRKNLRRLLEAFIQFKATEDQSINLVIGGKKGWKTDEIFAGLDLDRPDIILTGFVEDEHLPALYAHALALCYPSLYEGFGLPIAEAQACGIPVVYGDNSSQPEVAGLGGLAVDATSVADITAALRTLTSNRERTTQLAELAWRQSQQFSWLKTALLTLDAYESILYQRPCE